MFSYLKIGIIGAVMGALIASPVFLVPVASAQTKLAPIEISGWIPYWRKATGTAEALLHLDSFTEINPFGYSVKSNGTLADTAKMDEEPWTTLIAEAKKKKIRIVPTVMWSDGAAIHRILSNQKTRIALEDEITALVKEKGYDGIDINFEGKYAETKPYFSTFLKGLYMRMGKKWVMCSIEARTPLDSRYDGTPPPGAGQYANDFKEINKYCDRVRLMTYDQGSIDRKLNKARTPPYIPVSDPGWVEKTILLALKDIPKKKLVLGIPTYGYEYSYKPLPEYGFRYDKLWAFNPKYALDLAAQLGIAPTRNGANEISFIYDPSVLKQKIPNDSPFIETVEASTEGQLNIVWWSDAQAIKDKVDLARRLGLKGVAVFKIDGGGDPNMWQYLKKQ